MPLFLNVTAGAHGVAEKALQKISMYVSQARRLAARPGTCRGLSRSLHSPLWVNAGGVSACQAALQHEGSAAAADRKGTACMPGMAVQQIRCMSIVSRRRQQQQQLQKKAGDPDKKVLLLEEGVWFLRNARMRTLSLFVSSFSCTSNVRPPPPPRSVTTLVKACSI